MKLLLDTHAVLWFYLDDPQPRHVAKSGDHGPDEREV